MDQGPTNPAGPARNVWTELQNRPIELGQAIQRSLSGSFGLCCMNVRSEGNIGMMIRNACIMGADEVIVCGRKKYDARFTVGADHYIPVNFWPAPLRVSIDHKADATCTYDPAAFLECCALGNWTPVFIEQGGIDIRTVPWASIASSASSARPLLVMGNESSGIPRDFMDTVMCENKDAIKVSIPQWSVLRSMNVAMAAGIAMWEVRKSREKHSAISTVV